MTITEAIPISEEAMVEMLFAATRELFESMLGLEVSLAVEAPKESTEPFDGVLSLVGVTGKVIGTGALQCNATTACDLSSRFLMTEFQKVDEEVLDAVGELTNMIVGGFKTHLEAQLGRLQMSIPSVIHGKDISTSHPKADVSIAVKGVYSGGELRLSVGLAANGQ